MAEREDWVLLRRVSSDLEGDMIAGLLGDIPVYREYPGVNQMIKIAAGNPQWVELYIPASAWAEANALLNGSGRPLPDGEEDVNGAVDLDNEPVMEGGVCEAGDEQQEARLDESAQEKPLPHWGGTAVLLIFILICIFFLIVQNANNIF